MKGYVLGRASYTISFTSLFKRQLARLPQAAQAVVACVLGIVFLLNSTAFKFLWPYLKQLPSLLVKLLQYRQKLQAQKVIDLKSRLRVIRHALAKVAKPTQ